LNAGSDSTNSAAITYASGNWVAGTGVFTVASGDPAAAGVASGQWASVYPDGSSETVFVGRVTASSSTTITVSLAAKSGTAPTDGTGNRTLKIGGAWAGPAATVAFPLGFVANTHTNSSGHVPFVNIKNNATYSVTAAMTHAHAGPIMWGGYSSTIRDGGIANIDGGSTGASYILLTPSGVNNTLYNIHFSGNGATGSATLVTTPGTESSFERCAFSSSRGIGVYSNAAGVSFNECVAFENNESNTANLAGFVLAAISLLNRCIAHENTGSSTIGFRVEAVGVSLINCISDSNGNDGVQVNTSTGVTIIGLDSYNNSGDGLDFTGPSAATFFVSNSNFIENVGYGINSSGSTIRNGRIENCGFGSGTAANGSGTIGNLSGIQSGVIESGNITYATDVTPWADPGDGNFRISLSTAKSAGRGTFLQIQSGYGDPNATLAYPDIGAAQHQETATGTEKSFLFVK
jgi:hypothetical protein